MTHPSCSENLSAEEADLRFHPYSKDGKNIFFSKYEKRWHISCSKGCVFLVIWSSSHPCGVHLTPWSDGDAPQRRPSAPLRPTSSSVQRFVFNHQCWTEEKLHLLNGKFIKGTWSLDGACFRKPDTLKKLHLFLLLLCFGVSGFRQHLPINLTLRVSAIHHPWIHPQWAARLPLRETPSARAFWVCDT